MLYAKTLLQEQNINSIFVVVLIGAFISLFPKMYSTSIETSFDLPGVVLEGVERNINENLSSEIYHYQDLTGIDCPDKKNITGRYIFCDYNENTVNVVTMQSKVYQLFK